tara:strand:+ start:450 stop:1928 length:1479 start_codon:yes stop_codon:yes gene_type:complete
MNEKIPVNESVSNPRSKPGLTNEVDYSEQGAKLGEIKEREKLDRFRDICSVLSKSINDEYSTEEIFSALSINKYYLEFPDSLLDMSSGVISKLVESQLATERAREENYRAERTLGDAQRVESIVESLRSEGKSNTEIISQILKEHQEGILDLPPEKFSLYKNFLELSTNQEFGEDNEVITSIINSSSINFDDPASFEIVLQKVFDNSQVSERTKIKIEKRFGIVPIRNGFELRKSVKDRERLVDAYRKTVQGITENLENLNYSIIEIEETIKKLVLEIEESTTFDEQFELEDKRDELKKKLDALKARQHQLETDKSEIQTHIPNKEVVLLNGRVISKDGQFFITMPDDQVYALPKGLQNNELANTANGYFVWSVLDRIGLAQVLFPEEDLREGHLPTSKFTLTINSWLDKFNMSNSGKVMTMEELMKLEDIFDSLRSKSTLENKELSKEEGARIDLETMGVISNREVDYLKLNEVIEDMSLTKDGLYERDGS